MHCKSLWIKASAKCINVNVTGILWKCKTCSFVLSSGRPVQRSLFLVSVSTMMASVMMVMVSFLNRFRQSIVIQIHLLRALWCKSGYGASHGGIGNGLRRKTRWWLQSQMNAFGHCYLGILVLNTVLKLSIITLSCMLNLHFISDASTLGWTPDHRNDLRDHYDIKVSEAM